MHNHEDVGAPFEPSQALPFGLGGLIAGRYEVRGLLGEGGMGATRGGRSPRGLVELSRTP